MSRSTTRRLVVGAALVLSITWGPPGAAAQTAREVPFNDRGVIALKTQVRFTTLVALPDDEEILDVVCGDKEFWVIATTQHLAHIKPAKPKAVTNVNLVTASGRVYSFVLTESSDPPDLLVFVTRDGAGRTAPDGRPRFYGAAEVDALREMADRARQDAKEAEAAVTQRIADTEARLAADLPRRLRFPYTWNTRRGPVAVEAIFTDGRFTYVRARASELPALYELRDGGPTLVPFQVEDGSLYVVPRVLERGYLALGKARVYFARAED